MIGNIKVWNRILSVLLICLAVLLCASLCTNYTAYAASAVKLGQATNGEGGKLRGCKAGDQSGKEVSTSSWGYSKGSGSSYHWVYVFRAKDPEVAKKLAANMKAACANNHIGYDKNSPDRCTFYDEAKKVNWDISKIKRNCETTCASAVSVCINAAGISVPRLWYSEIVYKDIMKTGAFECLTAKEFTASDAKLLPGDILCNPKRHTAMVIESPNKFEFTVSYVGTNGKNTSTKVEEDQSIELNLNDGSKIKDVKITSNVDLSSYATKKSGRTFNGWIKVDDKSYSAQYKPSAISVATANKAVELK